MKLSGHKGCVNCIDFNQKGNKIISGSDNLTIIAWKWENEKQHLQFNSEHIGNNFHSKLLHGDLLICSCGRDGHVRLAELSVTGSLMATKILVQHLSPLHNMSVVPDSPNGILSAGEDGQIFSMVLRETKPRQLMLLKVTKKIKFLCIALILISPIFFVLREENNSSGFLIVDTSLKIMWLEDR